MSACAAKTTSKKLPRPNAEELRAKALAEFKGRIKDRDAEKLLRRALFDKDAALLAARNPFLFTQGGSSSLALKGIFWDKKSPMALIGADIFLVNDKVGDKKVLRINKTTVELIDANGKITVLRVSE